MTAQEDADDRLAALEALLSASIDIQPVTAASSRKKGKRRQVDEDEENAPDDAEDVQVFRLFSSQAAPQRVILDEPPAAAGLLNLEAGPSGRPATLSPAERKARRKQIKTVVVDGSDILLASKATPPLLMKADQKLSLRRLGRTRSGKGAETSIHARSDLPPFAVLDAISSSSRGQREARSSVASKETLSRRRRRGRQRARKTPPTVPSVDLAALPKPWRGFAPPESTTAKP